MCAEIFNSVYLFNLYSYFLTHDAIFAFAAKNLKLKKYLNNFTESKVTKKINNISR